MNNSVPLLNKKKKKAAEQRQKKKLFTITLQNIYAQKLCKTHGKNHKQKPFIAKLQTTSLLNKNSITNIFLILS